MPELPTGTVTFLFSDIEGSTKLLRRLGEGYPEVLADHQLLLLIALLALILARPSWCPSVLCAAPVPPTAGVHDADLQIFRTQVQSSIYVIPGDPAHYGVSNLPQGVAALRIDQRQAPPYRAVLGIHSLQRGRSGWSSSRSPW